MPYLAELALFLAPFAAYALWRWFNPAAAEPNRRLLLLTALGLGCAVAGAALYGFARSFPGRTVYVPPRYENGAITPGHAEPARPR